MATPTTIVLASLFGTILTTLGLLIAVLSAAGAPAYFFDDVLNLQEPVAWASAAVVWLIVTFIFAGSQYEVLASFAIYELYGWAIEDPFLITGAILTVFHAIAAFGAVVEENEGTSAH